MVRKVVKVELLRGLKVRPYMLEILERNNCSMDRKELINRVADEVYNRHCLTFSKDEERKKCREEAYEKAKTCLRDALTEGVVQIRDNKIILPKCVHIREISRGLKVLLNTLEYLSPTNYHVLQADIESGRLQFYIHECHDYLEYLRSRGINAEIVKDVEGILKIFLEHLITSKSFIKELLGRVIRREKSCVVLDLGNEAAAKLVSVLYELWSEEAVQRIMVEGCCRRCINLGLSRKCDVGEDDVKTIEAFTKMILGAACKLVAPKFELI